ncbi:hypothetical protein VSDG_09981 [Cytospora chrysosperma]|uniref:Uncharacterized protein n=1 Tax=Cytospora chrysosperma TaxID=252740 RepID=A0A423V8M0_CYTCH|nr:hypothetical protein VSDG_09981 [Valsa sordida]
MFAARSLSLASAALVATTMAQSTSVTSLFLYGSEGENIVASVMSVASGATTYFINCAEGTDSSDCGFGPGMTFVEGPSTFGLHVTEADAFTMDVDCKITSETASCVETDAGPEANDPGTFTGVMSDISDSLLPVTITAGLDLLSAGASASATASGSATSGTAQPSSSASSGPVETGSATSSSSQSSASSSASASASASAAKTATSASSSSAATGAAPRANGNLAVVAAGALVGLSGIMMAL